MGDEHLRTFDELPEAVWRSAGAQLIKNIDAMLSGGMPVFQKLSVLSRWDRELKNDLLIVEHGLGLMFEYDKDTGPQLAGLMKKGDIVELGKAIEKSSYASNRWIKTALSKWVEIRRSLSALATIDAEIREYVTWHVAADYVWMSARVTSNSLAMGIPVLSKGIPTMPDSIGGDKIVYDKTSAEILEDTEGALRKMADAVIRLPDDVLEHFLSRPNSRQQTPAEFRQEVASLTSPAIDPVVAIPAYIRRYRELYR
ncbi:MAG: hypothetical protein AB7G80_03350 [Dongiaceae bacterium]